MELVGSEFVDRLTYLYAAWLPARDTVKAAVMGRFEVRAASS